MTDVPEYWYARSGDHWFSRYHYSPVHWKGFAALFGAIFGCIGLLNASVLLMVFSLMQMEMLATKIVAVIIGVSGIILTIWLTVMAFKTLRKRVDPVNNAVHYRKKFFKI
jgi:uncharacterized membrane protein YuzA (DUF378 family)